MATVIKTYAIDNDLDSVWKRLADPEQIHHLFGFLTSAQAQAGSRVCRTADGAEIHERIFSVDHDTRRIAYTITRSPFGFEAHAASWQAAQADGDTTTVTLLVDVLPDNAAEALEAMLEQERATTVSALSRKPA
ncbi:MAG: SRPBCC family protein [Nannocystales bacterium]